MEPWPGPEHREQDYISAEPTSLQECVFFNRKDQPFSFTSMDSLEGKTVGITVVFKIHKRDIIKLNWII